MTNPILAAMDKPSGADPSVRQLYRAYKAAQDPGAFLNQILQKNPILAQIANSGNLQQAFYTLCQQRGVDPQTIINDIQR